VVQGGATPVTPPASQDRTFTVGGVTFKMIYIEGGTFTMGATSEQGDDAFDWEKPAHSVTLSSYSIGETEVTQALWEAVMGSNPSYFSGSNKPVECVSWNDCQDFISKLNSMTGQNFRLPTEAEWEYAARGGKKSRDYKYAGSNTIDNVAWYDENSYAKGSSSSEYGTHNVATKLANELGIYDMSGNVWEWCQDWYGSYSSGSQTNPTGPVSGSFRVGRGGSWLGDARHCRVSCRYFYVPTTRLNCLGLRLAL
jgi:formylglycine-generating enzyme required for sulfatase activity